MKDIVVGMDASDGAAAALRWAVEEGALHGWSVRAVMVWSRFDQHHLDDAFDPVYDQAAADKVLHDAVVAAIGEEKAAEVEQVAVDGYPTKALIEEADDARLLVVGARGGGPLTALLIGSVSDQVLHHATSPVAVVRERPGGERHGRIVVGVDGSERAQGAVQWAIAEARLRGATLEVVHAWQLPVATGLYAGTPIYPSGAEELARQVLDEAIEQEDTDGVAVERHLACAPASRALLVAAERADLVVVGSRGLGGFKGLLLGSVSRQLAHHATCPVVVT
ncbi:MAG TPA: universal stress protein [Acidimicrobiales bacterium]